MGAPLKPIPAVDKKTFDGCLTPVSDNDDKNYRLPTLEELGIEMPEESSSVLFPGGETEALRRLDEHMEKEVLADPEYLSFYLLTIILLFYFAKATKNIIEAVINS